MRSSDLNKYVGTQWTPDDERSERVEESSETLDENDDAEFEDLPVGMDVEEFLTPRKHQKRKKLLKSFLWSMERNIWRAPYHSRSRIALDYRFTRSLDNAEVGG